MDDDQAGAHIDAAFTRWEWRSQLTWTLDLRILTDAGISLAAAPAATDRAAAASRALRTAD